MVTRRKPTDADVALLWATASMAPDHDAIRDAATGADVGYVLETAEHHRVLQLTLRALSAAGIALAPTESWATSRAKLLEARANLAIPAAAASALDALEEANARPLVLKGLSIRDRYPAASLRPMDDIDLLVPRSLAGKASDALLASGWRNATHSGPDQRYDLLFVNPASAGIPLELHYELARWNDRPLLMSSRWLWERRTRSDVFGRPVWQLPPEVELLVHVVHAAKAFHVFNRMIWVVDLVVLTRTAKVDWDEVARLAAKARRRTATAIGLRLARRLGADVPDDLLGLPRRLARSGLLDAALDPSAVFASPTRPVWLGYAVVDGVSERLRYVAGDFMLSGDKRTLLRDLTLTARHGVSRLMRRRPL